MYPYRDILAYYTPNNTPGVQALQTLTTPASARGPYVTMTSCDVKVTSGSLVVYVPMVYSVYHEACSLEWVSQ